MGPGDPGRQHQAAGMKSRPKIEVKSSTDLVSTYHVASVACGPPHCAVGATVASLLLGTPPGRRTVKTEPLPGSLATVTSPPIMRASLRVMARPSPVPPNFCAVAVLVARFVG